MLLALGWIILSRFPNEYEGKPIASVQFDPERQPLSRDQLDGHDPACASGQPLHGSDVRDPSNGCIEPANTLDIADRRHHRRPPA